MASGNSADVQFDYEGALSLARNLWSFAQDLETAAANRLTSASAALKDWKGAYGDQFATRANNEQTDLATVVAGLRTEADGWAAAWKDAMDEQNRRLYARKVDKMKEDRNLLEKAGDFFTGFDYPPEPSPVSKPTAGGFYATATLGA
jgi:hypothetical protein